MPVLKRSTRGRAQSGFWFWERNREYEMNRRSILILLPILVLLSSKYSFAADTLGTSSDYVRGWASLGVGDGSWRGALAVTVGASLSAEIEEQLFTVRFLYTNEFRLNIFGETRPDNKIWELGFLYGRIARASYGSASISAGLGISSAALYSEPYFHPTTYQYSYDTDKHFGIGLPVEARLSWTPTNFLGIGLCAFGEYGFGSARSFAGVMLVLQFGDFGN